MTQGISAKLNNTSPVVYAIGGETGSYSHVRLTQLVHDAFATWSLPFTNLRFSYSGQLQTPVRSQPEWDALYERSTENAVVFDPEGKIFSGVSGTNVADVNNRTRYTAFTGPPTISLDGRIQRFKMLIGPLGMENEDILRATLVHEAGHVLGLDHSQVGSPDHRPTPMTPMMFPVVRDRLDISQDDIGALWGMYSRQQSTSHVHITGRVTQGGGVLRGANIVFEATRLIGVVSSDTPRYFVFSCVTDYLEKRTGGFDVWLVPGDYNVLVEPIHPRFVGPSSVGPYAATPTGLSFVDAIEKQPLGVLNVPRTTRVLVRNYDLALSSAGQSR